MSRAVLMSSCCDPFISLLAFKLYQERWYDEVDAFYINYNNHCQVPQDVVQEMCKGVLGDKKVRLIYHPTGIGNGPPVTEMVQICREDYVMLLEDDGFIFTPNKVNVCFRLLENDEYDIVGSPRYTHGLVAEAAKYKFNLDYSGTGDVGFAWWPNFFFCKRSDLLKTDLDFGSHTWQQGEKCPHLDYTFPEDAHGDTAVWLNVQLRAMGLRDYSIPQYHADLYEIENKRVMQGNWVNGSPYWIHGGSLSAGWGGYLSGKDVDVTHESTKRELESRCAFWTIAVDVIDGFDGFAQLYRQGIFDLMRRVDLDVTNIDKKIAIYRELINI